MSLSVTKVYNEIKNEKKFQEYLDGLLLGDGCISLSKREGRLPCFKLTVRSASTEWGNKVRTDITDFGLKCYIYGPYNRDEISTVSETHPFFQKMRKRWYAEGKKRVPYDLVINPTVLGDWCLGDGKLDRDDIITIFTEAFQFKEVKYLSNLLNSAIGILSFVRENEVGNPVIKVRACETSDFLAYIPEEYRLKCFKYKFSVKGNHKRMKWLSLEDELLRNEYGKIPASIISNKLKRSLSSIYHRANRLGLKGYGRS